MNNLLCIIRRKS